MNATYEKTLVGTDAVAPDRFARPQIPVTSQRFREATLPDAAIAESAPESEVPVDSPRGDTFQLYLREIGQVKLLTPEEEIELAERVQRGDPEAREHMIKANLRLVVKIARGYEGFGLPLLDLVSEGNIGLMKGVERFQPGKGAKLSTYVAWWIKQSIKRALSNQSKIICLPVHVTHKVARTHRATMKFQETLDRKPTPRRVQMYREPSRAPISLDSPVSSDDQTLISETIPDENAPAPFDELVKDNDLNMLQEILSTLDARQRKILAMRFGLEDGTPKTFDQIGESLGITRERTRQIQQQALEKMRQRMKKRDRKIMTTALKELEHPFRDRETPHGRDDLNAAVTRYLTNGHQARWFGPSGGAPEVRD